MLATKEDYLILLENVHGVVARTFGPVRPDDSYYAFIVWDPLDCMGNCIGV